MANWITFCLFFIVVPILINTFLRISQILKGPLDDSEYQSIVYQRRLRRALIELGILFVVLIGIGGVLIFVWLGGQ